MKRTEGTRGFGAPQRDREYEDHGRKLAHDDEGAACVYAQEHGSHAVTDICESRMHVRAGWLAQGGET